MCMKFANAHQHYVLISCTKFHQTQDNNCGQYEPKFMYARTQTGAVTVAISMKFKITHY